MTPVVFVAFLAHLFGPLFQFGMGPGPGIGGPPPASGPAVVAHTKYSGGPNGGTTAAIDTTGANFLVAVIGSYSGSDFSGHFSDSKGNTWNFLTMYTFGSNSTCQIAYSTPSSVGSGHTFTSSSAGTYNSFDVAAFSGMVTSSVFQAGKDVGNTTGASSTAQPGSITGTGKTLLITGMGWNSPGGVMTVNSSFAITDQADYSANNFGSALAWLYQSSGSAINPTWSSPSGSILVPVMAAFTAQ